MVTTYFNHLPFKTLQSFGTIIYESSYIIIIIIIYHNHIISFIYGWPLWMAIVPISGSHFHKMLPSGTRKSCLRGVPEKMVGWMVTYAAVPET